MIGYWHNTVFCPSAGPSVRVSVTLCIVALRVDVQGYRNAMLRAVRSAITATAEILV